MDGVVCALVDVSYQHPRAAPYGSPDVVDRSLPFEGKAVELRANHSVQLQISCDFPF
jgi:hypothetical protein